MKILMMIMTIFPFRDVFYAKGGVPRRSRIAEFPLELECTRPFAVVIDARFNLHTNQRATSHTLDPAPPTLPPT